MAQERHPRYAQEGESMWIALPLGEDWDSIVRFVSQGGHPVVAELRIVPRTDTPGVPAELDDHEDDWSDVIGGAAPPTPEGGLTTRALRDVHLGHALELAYAQLGRAFERGRRHPSFPPPASFAEHAVSTPRRPGRKGREDSFYAAVAAAYVDAIERGSRKPVVDAADTLSEAWGGTHEPTYVRDLLHVARQRGLLTRPPKGRAGGQLTDKACVLIQREDTR
jgi:hypothetical protein